MPRAFRAGSSGGRDAFAGLAPEGVTVRMMEPGEAEALRRLWGCEEASAEGPPLAGFVRWLLAHEVFVAEAEGASCGFAAARDAGGLYWLSGLAIAPDMRGRGVRAALLRTVEARAGWFFHRAVALALPAGSARADWYRRHRFIGVPPGDWTPELAALAAERPGGTGVEEADGARPARDVSSPQKEILLHWL